LGNTKDEPIVEENDSSDKENQETISEPVVQDEVPEEIHVDEQGKEYTIDTSTGLRKYLLEPQQYELNETSRKTIKKEKKELVNKIVAEMRSTGSWPGAGYLENEGVIKKKIEDIFADDASLELKELISRADSSVLNEVYKEIIKDTKA